jgi:hypothetical protein
VPFGCQLLSRGYSRIALLNCCNYPLDRSAYCPADYSCHKDTIDGWAILRSNPSSRRRKNRRHEQLERELLAGLEKRLQSLPQTSLIIPCGSVARALLAKCSPGKAAVYGRTVPHPSRNQWQGKRNFGDVDDFIKTVRRQLR